MDFVQLWENFRLGVLIVVVLAVIFFIYYGFIASTGKARVERAKTRARQIIESGEITEERTFNYVYYMLQRVPRDGEAKGLLVELDKLKIKQALKS